MYAVTGDGVGIRVVYDVESFQVSRYVIITTDNIICSIIQAHSHPTVILDSVTADEVDAGIP